MRESAVRQLVAALAALQRTEDKVHAYRHLLIDEARAAATAADAEPRRSPIHGWPFAVKEVFDVAGVPTSAGSAAFADRVPAADATVVARLRAAGAVLVGTQISHELTVGLDVPPTRNPWDTARYPGGSSAGAGVSVAVGSARFALGTDAAGSVRIPAAMTGTTGLKASFGCISGAGLFPRATGPSIDNVGIIARDVADLHAVFSVVAGPDPADPRTLWSDVPGTGPLHAADPNGMTLAVLGRETIAMLNEVHEVEPDVARTFAIAEDVFRAAGAKIVPIELPQFTGALGAIFTLFGAELAAGHRDHIGRARELYFPAIADLIEANLAPEPAALVEAVRVRSDLRRAVNAGLATSGASFLLTPLAPRVAMDLGTFDPADELVSVIAYTCAFNLTGHPALSVPAGFDADGLPIGLQIVGWTGRDIDVLSLGALFQSLTDWHGRTPLAQLPKVGRTVGERVDSLAKDYKL